MATDHLSFSADSVKNERRAFAPTHEELRYSSFHSTLSIYKKSLLSPSSHCLLHGGYSRATFVIKELAACGLQITGDRVAC